MKTKKSIFNRLRPKWPCLPFKPGCKVFSLFQIITTTSLLPCQQFQSSWRVKNTLCPVFRSGYGKKVRRALKNTPSIDDIYFELCFLQNRCTLGLYRTPLKKTSTGSCRKCRREPNSSGTRPRKAEKTMFRYKHYTIFPFIFSHRHTHSNAAQWKALGE